MKILNIFKKENKKSVALVAKKLDKNQLEKVIGGGGGDTLNEVEVAVRSRSNIKTQ